MTENIPDRQAAGAPLPFLEFVCLMAMLMAMSALGIDIMLPALSDISRDLDIENANNTQLVVSIFLLGNGIGAFLVGPIADAVGRRPVLMVGLIAYATMALMSAMTTDFEFLLLTRFLNGVAASCSFVMGMAIVRDSFSGDEMARLMSLVAITFMIVPVMAPTLGQMVLYVGEWHDIFLLLVALALLVLVWVWVRLPETLQEHNRTSLSFRKIGRVAREVATHRQAAAYMLGSAIFFGGIFGFINSAEQIFGDIFAAGDFFPFAFAIIAGSMAVTNFINSRLVLKLGARRISHVALIFFCLWTATQLVLSPLLATNMTAFIAVMSVAMAMMGFIGANFGSIALDPFGHVAGTASSVQMGIRMLSGAIIGATIGHAFDGTVVPMLSGFLICGLLSLTLVLIAERGRLFAPTGDPVGPDHHPLD